MNPPQGSTAAVILAAGLGTRMRSRLPKVLHPLCGRPMLGYVIDAVTEATGRRPVVVYSPSTAAIRDVFPEDADFALQDVPRGTADAVRAALAALPEDVSTALIVNGDKPLFDSATAARLLQVHAEAHSVMTLVTLQVPASGAHARVVRTTDGWAAAIVEVKDDPDRAHFLEVEGNTGVYAVDVPWIRESLGRLQPSPVTGELYLTSLVEMAAADGQRVAVMDAMPDPAALMHVKDRHDLAAAGVTLRARMNARLMRAGVTMHDPATAFVDATVTLAEDVVLEPNVILRGSTAIGRDTVVRSGTQIFDSVIGERCVIWASVLESAEVEDDVQIGPFAHLRPGASIGRGAKLGNFAEVKKSRIGAGTQQHHFSYIGDAVVGEGVNIAAGTITANYDGRNKLKTTIGDRAFLGVDTMLVAPVEIGEGAYTGAGAVVTKDVPPGKLAVGVPARIRERRNRPPEPEAP